MGTNIRSLSSVGGMALRSETDSNRSIPCAVLRFGEGMTLQHMNEIILKRIAPRFPRFRSLVSEDTTVFEEIELTSYMDKLVSEDSLTSLDGDGEQEIKRAVELLVSSHQNEPLNRSRPLWRMWLYHYDLTSGKTGTYVYWRVHHCIADGVSLGLIFKLISDSSFRKDEKELRREALGAADRKPSRKSLVKNIVTPVILALGCLIVMMTWTWMALRSLLPGAAPSILKSPHMSRKWTAAWAHLHEVERTKAVCEKLSKITRSSKITVNDFMLTVVSSAMERYLRERGVDAAFLPIAIPVNMRTTENMFRIGNVIGSISLQLPIDKKEPAERVFAISKLMARKKMLPEPQLTHFITKLCARLPDKVTKLVVDCLSSQVYACVSNVQGPTKKLYWGGVGLEMIAGLVPPPNSVMLGIGFASYNGRMIATVNADATLGDFAHEFVKLLESEYIEYEREAMSDSPSVSLAKKTS